MIKTSLLFLIALSIISCQPKADESKLTAEKGSNQIIPFSPSDKKLFDEIAAMDQLFFNAYNNCDLEKQASIYSDDVEFFHDQGGLITSKEEIIAGTKKFICDKVTRTLVEGSMEVYPINDYGAVEIGYHTFYNNQEPDAPSHPSKFIIMWKKENNTWHITKVISLH